MLRCEDDDMENNLLPSAPSIDNTKNETGMQDLKQKESERKKMEKQVVLKCQDCDRRFKNISRLFKHNKGSFH